MDLLGSVPNDTRTLFTDERLMNNLYNLRTVLRYIHNVYLKIELYDKILTPLLL